MLKVFKVLRIFSVIIFLIVLTLSYAYIPLTIDSGWEAIDRVGRGQFFYGFLGLFVAMGAMFYFLIFYVENREKHDNVRAMIHVLPFIFNLSLTLIVGSIGLRNNTQGVDAALFNYLNYLAAALPILWFFALIFSLVKAK